ncbi:hypothetical protein SOASR014_15940 [Pectobacterium carotovorum subsp. carotovorum]|nr:hypothetical protein SOASR014_15940 [Pectobacterium carotovorum subsp. carotovorum]GLX44659.1 hypothetical protein Pcaca01_23270 [Pectobacterium carotovorum subsp. carotovorum]
MGDGAVVYRACHHGHRAERASQYTAFAADALFLNELNAIVFSDQGLRWAYTGAGGIFTVTAGYGSPQRWRIECLYSGLKHRGTIWIALVIV